MRKELFFLMSGLLVIALSQSAAWAQQKSKKSDNIIVTENSKPGTTDWILTKVTRKPDESSAKGWQRRTEIEGYVSDMSLKAGDTLNIYVSTDPSAYYKLDIYRMGYYGGKGGRLVMTLSPHKGLPKGKVQFTPVDGINHIIECKWEVSAKIKIPDDWISGVYLGKLSTWDPYDAEAYIIFIVRDDRKAELMFQCSDLTWASYNRWPQWRSLYDSPPRSMETNYSFPLYQWSSRTAESYSAGFDRPYGIYYNGCPSKFEPITNGSGEFLLWEFPLAFWLEKEGYDVTYISNLDTHSDGSGLLRGKVFLSVGHDEYWTEEMYNNVVKARDAGINLAFLCGNSVSGRVELLKSTDGRPNRGMRSTGYKDGNFDEINLMGAATYGVGMGDWTCAAPDHWAFAGTGMKKGDFIPELVGWEYHGPPIAYIHKDLVVLAEGPLTNEYGVPIKQTYAATIYTAPKGNYVFNAATCWWTKVLSAPPAYVNPAFIDHFKDGDERVRKITKNILDRMIAVEINK
jgi:hypothetical protein